MISYTATYSPEDNKLRLRASARLDPETYKRVKDAGFIWAPRQDLFVAPMWTPAREDFAIELAGEIGDEDTSLVDRAEERAERFEGYSDRRGEEADRARAAVDQLAGGIPLGQPILVGHHSERRARRDAEKIRNGTDRAIRLWETSKYWTARAAGAIRHAKYKERPDVRARRIHTLEADQRKRKRELAEAERLANAWERLSDPASVTRGGEEIPFASRVRYVAGRGAGCRFDLGSDLDAGKLTAEEAQAQTVAALRARAVSCSRWIAHLDNRLAYERALLEASGWTPPARPKTKSDLPLLNISGAVAYRNPYRNGEIIRETAHPMTKAELASIHPDYKGTRMSEDGTHRLRYAMLGRGREGSGYGIVFLTDSKEHERPGDEARRTAAEAEDQAAAEREAALDQQARRRTARSRPAPSDRDRAFASLRETARAGVQVVAAPQLFPTPMPLARQLVRAVAPATCAGLRVLEPSAGTGNLIRAVIDSATGADNVRIVAVEINAQLAQGLRDQRQKTLYATEDNFAVWCADFRDIAPDSLDPFDLVVMNPPFVNGSDIEHVQHALKFLKPGGRLAAIVAGGPRQKEALAHLGTWTDLPEGSFASQGTNVRVAMLVVQLGAAVAVAS